jgi:hypothetical protein
MMRNNLFLNQPKKQQFITLTVNNDSTMAE